MPDYFVARTSDCWLRVQLAAGQIASLCFGLQVSTSENQEGREHFTILEGINKGKKASVATSPGQSYLTTKLKHGPAASVRFDRAKQTLYFNGRGPRCRLALPASGGHIRGLRDREAIYLRPG
jgi:hypothetical protein